jgi:hypothetical protein
VKVHLPVESRKLLRNQEDDHVEATHFIQHPEPEEGANLGFLPPLNSLAIALTLTSIDEKGKGIQTSSEASPQTDEVRQWELGEASNVK